jgi:hypothetical protein
LGLLQGWLDVGAMGILSLLCFIWAGRTLLGFCLLTFTFISLISSGSGRTSNEFQPCKQALPVVVNAKNQHCCFVNCKSLISIFSLLNFVFRFFALPTTRGLAQGWQDVVLHKQQ